MTKKLLFTLLSFAIFSISYSQQEASDYQSNLEEPSAMVNKGNILYVQGLKKLYEINTASGSPTANVIYTSKADFYMSNLTISGSIIYISEEHVTVDAQGQGTAHGCQIIAIDLNNLSAPVNVVYSTAQYVSSLAVKGDIMYFTSETDPDAFDHYTLQVHKIDLTVTNPVATVVVNNLTQNNAATEMAFYNNNLLILVGRQGIVYGFDVTDDVTKVSQYYSDGNSNSYQTTGLFVNGDDLYLVEGNTIKRKININSDSPFHEIIGNNTGKTAKKAATATFHDLVILGDKLYISSPDQGKVTTTQNPTLDKKEFNENLKAVTVHTTKTQLIVNGLENSHKATVYNLSGQLIASKEVSASDNSIDISSYSNGAYIIRLGSKSFKFIK